MTSAPDSAALVVQGDSTTPAPYAAVMRGSRADALLTDPPYCLLTRRRKHGDERDKKDRKIERGPLRRFDDVKAYRQFTRQWLGEAVKHLTPVAPLVIWTNLLGRAPITAVANELGWAHLWGEFVWGKRTREGNSGEEILRVVETALVFHRTPKPASSVEALALPWAVVAGYDDDGEAEAWGNHPNHKPFGVIDALVRTWSRPGQLVLDPFAGSGSIPAGALKLGRRVAAIELENDWAGRVAQRLKATA